MGSTTIESAVAFLQDEKVRDAPLQTKIEFLQSKGLTQAEIQLALAQASSDTRSFPVPVPSHPRTSWTELSLSLSAVVALGYAGSVLFMKHVLPLISWPTTDDLKTSSEEISEQISAANDALAAVKKDTLQVASTLTDQAEKVEDSLNTLESSISGISKSLSTRENTVREIKEEISSIQEMIPRMLERNRDAHTNVLKELQGEIRSIKALLVGRVGSSGSDTPGSGLNIPSTPSIPAWQLAPEGQDEANDE
ncbi:MAG: hypothetical protein SGCHY_003856 [Lobulomycetales sp.]